MGIIWFCTACTEQDELPAADLQPLAFTISEPLPFQEMTAGASGFTPQTASMDDPHAHTRVADSGTTLSWNNGDKVYLAVTITSGGTTTYAYATTTYSSSGSTWSALDPAISVPVGATVNVEALYAKGTLSGNTITIADNSIIMKATATDIAITAATSVPLTFQSALVRAEVTGIGSNSLTAEVKSSSVSIPQSVDIQPADGSFSITSKTSAITSNAVYYVLPGALSIATENGKTFSLSGMKANSSYLLDISGAGGNVTADGSEFNKAVTLNLGNYADALGTVSRVVLNGTSYTATHAAGNTYTLST